MMPACGYSRKIVTIFGRDFVYHCQRPAKFLRVINFRQVAACDKHELWYVRELNRLTE